MANETNQKNKPRRVIPGSNGSSDEEQKKRPKFNIYWIYGILFAAVIGYNYFSRSGTGGINTNIENFKEILKRGDVEKIVIIRNREIVKFPISKETLTSNSEYYRTLFKSDQYDALLKMEQPHLYFTISDEKTFTEQMDDFRRENPALKTYYTTYDDEGELFGTILQTLFPILVIGLLFIMMMRKVGGAGSGGGPGGIFNIGKSKAQLFDKGTRVNINFGEGPG